MAQKTEWGLKFDRVLESILFSKFVFVFFFFCRVFKEWEARG